MVVAVSVTAVILLRTREQLHGIVERQPGANLSVPAINPLQIPTAFTFAAIFVIISVIAAWVRGTYGQTGVLAMAAAVGATDIDPFVINIAQGGVSGLSVTTLAAAILIAASSNNIAKAIYALGFGGVKSSRRAAWMLFVLAILGFASAAAVHILPLTQTGIAGRATAQAISDLKVARDKRLNQAFE